jgi:pyruvate dehydrogenase E1 component beta subunit
MTPGAPPAKGGRRLTIAEALREAIAEEMRHDEKVFLIGEDVGVPGGFGGAFGVYLGLADEFGHERIIDTPISEKAIAGAAVGAALMGMRPIPDLQYSDFIFECMDELVNQAAKMRYMSNGKLSVPGELLRARARPQGRLCLRCISRQGTAEERGARR